MQVPAYRIITNDLTKAMDSGRLKPGARVPSIRELCDRYNVSQITVLRVFKELVQADRIVRREGTGYYVKDPADTAEPGRTLILACRSPRAVSEDDNFILRMTEGIHTRALEEGFNLFVPRTVAFIRGRVIDDAHMENLMRDIREVPRPAGIIFDMFYPDDMIRKHVLPHIGNLPCTIAGRRSTLPIPTVSPDFEKAADDASLLAAQSRAEEFFLYENEDNPWGGNALLCRRLRDNLIRSGVAPDLIHLRGKIGRTFSHDQSLIDELEKKIRSSERKVMAFSTSDYFSKYIMDNLQKTCRFGSRASLVTFGGFEFMMKNNPPVTSLVINARQLGVLAAELILKNDMASYAESRTADVRIELNKTL